MIKISIIYDEEINDIKEKLYDLESDTPKFNPKAQLLNTSYFTEFVKLVARLLPKLKAMDEKLSLVQLLAESIDDWKEKIKTWKEKIKTIIEDINTRLDGLESTVVELEGRIELLEES